MAGWSFAETYRVRPTEDMSRHPAGLGKARPCKGAHAALRATDAARWNGESASSVIAKGSDRRTVVHMINTGYLAHHRPSSLAAVETVLKEMQAVAQSVADRSETCESIATKFHRDLQALAQRSQVTIDRQLAEDLCLALGRTYGLWFAEGSLGRDRASRRFIRERMEDLVATIECNVEAALLVTGTRRMLKEMAALSAEDLADGEYVSDLFLVAAAAVTLTAVDE